MSGVLPSLLEKSECWSNMISGVVHWVDAITGPQISDALLSLPEVLPDVVAPEIPAL
jgi:hypothetical protein